MEFARRKMEKKKLTDRTDKCLFFKKEDKGDKAAQFGWQNVITPLKYVITNFEVEPCLCR